MAQMDENILAIAIRNENYVKNIQIGSALDSIDNFTFGYIVEEIELKERVQQSMMEVVIRFGNNTSYTKIVDFKDINWWDTDDEELAREIYLGNLEQAEKEFLAREEAQKEREKNNKEAKKNRLKPQ